MGSTIFGHPFRCVVFFGDPIVVIGLIGKPGKEALIDAGEWMSVSLWSTGNHMGVGQKQINGNKGLTPTVFWKFNFDLYPHLGLHTNPNTGTCVTMEGPLKRRVQNDHPTKTLLTNSKLGNTYPRSPLRLGSLPSFLATCVLCVFHPVQTLSPAICQRKTDSVTPTQRRPRISRDGSWKHAQRAAKPTCTHGNSQQIQHGLHFFLPYVH